MRSRSSRVRQPILRQAPSRIKWVSMADNGNAIEQSLETNLRCHDMQCIHLPQKGLKADIWQDLIGNRCNLLHLDIRRSEPRHNVRMRFVDQPGLRLIRSGCAQKVNIATNDRRAPSNGGVIFHLSGNKDHSPSLRPAPGCALKIVFRQTQIEDPPVQSAGAIHVEFGHISTLEYCFEARRAGGIEMHAVGVETPGIGLGQVSAETA